MYTFDFPPLSEFEEYSPPEVGYLITQEFFGKPTPQVVTISFQVGAPEWCKLEQGDEWLNFEEALTSLQKAQEHYMHSYRPRGLAVEMKRRK